MRSRPGCFVAVSLVAMAACGPAFSASTDDLDATPGSNEAGSDRNAADAPSAPPVNDALLLWLRADAGVTITAGAVSEWADLSGNHLDAQQTDTTLRPTWAATGLSGRPTVTFAGGDFLSLPSGFADFSRGISIFVVAAIANAGACVDLVHLSNGPEIDDIALGRHNGHGNFEVLEGVLTGPDISLGRAELLSVVHESNGTATMRLDGGGKTTAMFDLPRIATRLDNAVGKSFYTECDTLQGGIAEILIYRRALDDAERSRVESDLQNRWACCH